MFKYDVIDFEQRLNIRVKSEDRNAIKLIISKTGDVYDSESHFIRCAIRRLIRFEANRLKIKITQNAR